MKFFCQFCGEELDLGREFVYQLESLDFEDDDARLEFIRQAALYYGEPLRTCKKCQQNLEQHQLDLGEDVQASARDGKRSARAWFFDGTVSSLISWT